MPGGPPPPTTTDPWLPEGYGLDLDAVPITVSRVGGPGRPDEGQEVELASLECLTIEDKEGPHPSVARFRYRFGDGNAWSPQSIEEALGTQNTLPDTVEPGDELVVRATMPDGFREVIFWGFPYGFEGKLGEETEEVTLVAIGVARRLSDIPCGGMLMRDASEPLLLVGARTSLPAVFNPKGVGNATGTKADGTPADANPEGGPGDRKYPVFIDPLSLETGVDGLGAPVVFRRLWTLPMAARYLCYHRARDEAFNLHEEYVQLPDGADLDDLLVAREPIEGTAFDPADPDTYTVADLVVPNTPFTGKDWPRVLHSLIGAKGFGMRYFTYAEDAEGDDFGRPRCRLDLYLSQTRPLKDLYLQARFSTLDLDRSNVGAADLTRDVSDAPNSFLVEGAPVRHEASFVLQCLYPSNGASDAAEAYLKHFSTADPDFATTYKDAYRLYGFDETADGHYAPGSSTPVYTLPSLDDVLGTYVDENGDTVRDYAIRRRPPLGELATLGPDKKPLRARLSYSTDYTGPAPAVWDGSQAGTLFGTWKPIHGGYQLLKDRLGIRITAENPNHWKVGEEPGAAMAVVLKGVEAQANPGGVNQPFFLRLTCQIEADVICKGEAPRRDAAALTETVWRRVDARDRHVKQVVQKWSEFNNTDTDVTDPPDVRNDTDRATAEAIALRDSTDAGVLDGSVTIPRFTAYYEVGDRIRQINGRDLGFRTDGGDDDDTPVYPVVVAIKWTLSPGQSTHLTMSDSVVNRHSYRRAARSLPHAAPAAASYHSGQ